MSAKTWKEVLGARVPVAWGREIDIFETQMELRKKGKIEEKLFAETRLRRGAYGQRYDNGQRHDGEKTQALVFPSGDVTKGPSTLWDDAAGFSAALRAHRRHARHAPAPRGRGDYDARSLR
jgi:sulfite reductase (ferredoxin)